MAKNIEEIRQKIMQNRACSESLAEIISANSSSVKYGVNFDAEKSVEQALEKFPANCVALVIAHEVIPDRNYLDNPQFIDGRYSRKVREWAKETIKGEENFNFREYEYCHFRDRSHPIIVNSLAEKFIEKQNELVDEETVEEYVEETVEENVEEMADEEMCL